MSPFLLFFNLRNLLYIILKKLYNVEQESFWESKAILSFPSSLSQYIKTKTQKNAPCRQNMVHGIHEQ